MRYLVAALLVAACAPEEGAVRDYSLAACPPPWGPEVTNPVDRLTVCDRGAGASPRFVTLAACQSEVNPQPPHASYALESTHPARLMCRATIGLVTIDDVRALAYETAR
jgi:hypothetical protein